MSSAILRFGTIVYDDMVHDSREVVALIAILIAVVLFSRVLRACCERAAAGSKQAVTILPGARFAVLFTAAVSALSCGIVPLMECFDGALNGASMPELADAFGGSLVLGLGTTIVCAAIVALAVVVAARWLLSHRHTIATLLETLLQIDRGRSPEPRFIHCTLDFAASHRLALLAVHGSKRGPPL